MEAVARRCYVKEVFSKLSLEFSKAPEPKFTFLIKLQGDTSNFIKNETLAQVLFFEFCGFFKNTFFNGKTSVAASVYNEISFSKVAN